MRINTETDYAIRAAVELARADGALTLNDLVAAQGISRPQQLRDALSCLRRRGLVVAQRGYAGGYRLARPAHTIALADIVRATSGELTQIRGVTPGGLDYPREMLSLVDVWLRLD